MNISEIVFNEIDRQLAIEIDVVKMLIAQRSETKARGEGHIKGLEKARKILKLALMPELEDY